MSPSPLDATLARLSEAAWTTAALTVAVEAGVVDALGTPRTVGELASVTRASPGMLRPILDVLVELGLATWDGPRLIATAELAGRGRDGLAGRVLRDELRRIQGQPRALVEDARAGRLAPGWRTIDPELIDAQGTFAELHTRLLFVEGIVPRLGPLGERLLGEGGMVLDVGAGAGGNAIGFARAWPRVRVVGLEPWEPSRGLGLRNVEAAGLSGRVQLRDQRVEHLDEVDTYDLVWLPQMFLDEPTLAVALARCRAALRPDGWLVTAWIADEGAPGLSGALARLRDVAFGGAARGEATLRRRLAEAGYGELTSASFGGMGTLAGRRA